MRSEAPLGVTYALCISTKICTNTLTANRTESARGGFARIAAYCICVGTLSTPHHQYSYKQFLSFFLLRVQWVHDSAGMISPPQAG